MMISCSVAFQRTRSWRSAYSVQGQPFLENLAHSARGLAEPARRNAGRPVESAYEIRKIAEADFVGDIGDGNTIFGQQAGRMSQSRSHQILVRSDAEHA